MVPLGRLDPSGELLRHGIGEAHSHGWPLIAPQQGGHCHDGGLYILAAVGLVVLALRSGGIHKTAHTLEWLWPAFGLLGVYDDLQGLKDIAGVGWLARFKFAWQWLAAILVAVVMFSR